MADNIGSESGAVREDIRMTAPRDWPNNAGEARDRAAEASEAGLRALKPIVTGMNITEADLVRRVAVAAHNLEHIARMMEAMGAKTDPLSEDFWG